MRGWASAKYYVDELYQKSIVGPYLGLCRIIREFDERAIDGLVNAVWRTADRITSYNVCYTKLLRRA